MTEEEKKNVEDYKRVIAMYFKYSDYDLFCSNLMKSGIKGTIQNTMADMINLIEKLQKENEELRNTKNNCPQFNTSGIKCKNKDIHCPTSKETLDYYENFLISGYEEEIKKLKKENKELKNKVIKRDNELIDLEETSEKEFLTKQEVKDNYIPKDKIREKIKEKEAEKQGVKNISLEEYAITSKELKESEICLLKCLLEEEYKNE